MSLLTYFKPQDGIPDPNGLLSVTVPSGAIALVNKEVEISLNATKEKKRGPYVR